MAADDPTDSTLVRSSLSGDREAFARLYDRYARVVRGVVYPAAGGASVEDLTQECFLRAFRKLGTLAKPESFGPWLVSIARKLVQEQSRRRRHRSLESPETVEVEPSHGLDDIDELRHLLRQVADLPEMERLAMQLFYLQERNIGEVGRLLGLSRSGTYALLNRACGHLAERLERAPAHREAPP